MRTSATGCAPWSTGRSRKTARRARGRAAHAGSRSRSRCPSPSPSSSRPGTASAGFASLAAQTQQPAEVVVVDNGSTDATLAWLAREAPQARVLAQGRNTGFAVAANRGLLAARTEFVALLNTDIELAPDWIEVMAARLAAEPRCASVACKMVRLGDETLLDDCGDVLRRDGVCEQRGHGRRDDGRWDTPGE
ncbi:MAG: glycosyltransferase, partial [Actinobacteria bacterium]